MGFRIKTGQGEDRVGEKGERERGRIRVGVSDSRKGGSVQHDGVHSVGDGKGDGEGEGKGDGTWLRKTDREQTERREVIGVGAGSEEVGRARIENRRGKEGKEERVRSAIAD